MNNSDVKSSLSVESAISDCAVNPQLSSEGFMDDSVMFGNNNSHSGICGASISSSSSSYESSSSSEDSSSDDGNSSPFLNYAPAQLQMRCEVRLKRFMLEHPRTAPSITMNTDQSQSLYSKTSTQNAPISRDACSKFKKFNIVEALSCSQSCSVQLIDCLKHKEEKTCIKPQKMNGQKSRRVPHRIFPSEDANELQNDTIRNISFGRKDPLLQNLQNHCLTNIKQEPIKRKRIESDSLHSNSTCDISSDHNNARIKAEQEKMHESTDKLKHIPERPPKSVITIKQPTECIGKAKTRLTRMVEQPIMDPWYYGIATSGLPKIPKIKLQVTGSEDVHGDITKTEHILKTNPYNRQQLKDLRRREFERAAIAKYGISGLKSTVLCGKTNTNDSHNICNDNHCFPTNVNKTPSLYAFGIGFKGDHLESQENQRSALKFTSMRQLGSGSIQPETDLASASDFPKQFTPSLHSNTEGNEVAVHHSEGNATEIRISNPNYQMPSDQFLKDGQEGFLLLPDPFALRSESRAMLIQPKSILTEQTALLPEPRSSLPGPCPFPPGTTALLQESKALLTDPRAVQPEASAPGSEPITLMLDHKSRLESRALLPHPDVYKNDGTKKDPVQQTLFACESDSLIKRTKPHTFYNKEADGYIGSEEWKIIKQPVVMETKKDRLFDEQRYKSGQQEQSKKDKDNDHLHSSRHIHTRNGCHAKETSARYGHRSDDHTSDSIPAHLRKFIADLSKLPEASVQYIPALSIVELGPSGSASSKDDFVYQTSEKYLHQHSPPIPPMPSERPPDLPPPPSFKPLLPPPVPPIVLGSTESVSHSSCYEQARSCDGPLQSGGQGISEVVGTHDGEAYSSRAEHHSLYNPDDQYNVKTHEKHLGDSHQHFGSNCDVDTSLARLHRKSYDCNKPRREDRFRDYTSYAATAGYDFRTPAECFRPYYQRTNDDEEIQTDRYGLPVVAKGDPNDDAVTIPLEHSQENVSPKTDKSGSAGLRTTKIAAGDVSTHVSAMGQELKLELELMQHTNEQAPHEACSIGVRYDELKGVHDGNMLEVPSLSVPSVSRTFKRVHDDVTISKTGGINSDERLSNKCMLRQHFADGNANGITHEKECNIPKLDQKTSLVSTDRFVRAADASMPAVSDNDSIDSAEASPPKRSSRLKCAERSAEFFERLSRTYPGKYKTIPGLTTEWSIRNSPLDVYDDGERVISRAKYLHPLSLIELFQDLSEQVKIVLDNQDSNSVLKALVRVIILQDTEADTFRLLRTQNPAITDLSSIYNKALINIMTHADLFRVITAAGLHIHVREIQLHPLVHDMLVQLHLQMSCTHTGDTAMD